MKVTLLKLNVFADRLNIGWKVEHHVNLPFGNALFVSLYWVKPFYLHFKCERHRIIVLIVLI